jgi:hypothetical protein
MFASYSLRAPITILRASVMAGSIILLASHAAAAPLCKPALAFKEVRFSAIQPETMERHWTASLAVDASQCATTSGRFEILFSRLKENGPEVEFVEPFTWKPTSVEVSVVFWADEAVEGYWLNRIASCPCRE